MATKNKKENTPSEKNNLKVAHSPNKTLKAYQSGRVIDIPLDLIDFSPFNDRNTEYSDDDLETFAKDIDRNGVQVPIMVRPINGRLELIYGERRTRASRIAALTTIPAFIRKGLTDEEVMFIQILENFDRKDPHPMDMAKSFNRLKGKGYSDRDIAARLGRSKSFVISRLKLIQLTADWQRIYRLNKMTTFEAFEVASLSQETQEELFQKVCKNWRDKNFKVSNLDYYISRFKYELKRAPFDIKDKNLYPEAGACIGCPHNSATFRTLFVEYSKDGVCSKKECFQTKCSNHLSNQFGKILSEEKPEALIFNGTPPEQVLNVINQIEDTSQLQQLEQSSITILDEPEEPSKDDYAEEYSDEEPTFDEEGYKQAVEDYNSEMEEYNKQKLSAKKGLLFQGGIAKAVLFLPEPKSISNPERKSTAKDVALAIKNGTVTVELLLGEKDRILKKAKRDLELDEEKIMEAIYDKFEKKVSGDELNCSLTEADKTAMRYLIFLQLGYSGRNKVEELLFDGKSNDEKKDREVFYQTFNAVDDQKISFMARKVLLTKTESKQPSNPLSQFLYKMAKEAGVDVEAIEKQQQVKAAERADRQAQRLSDLDRRIQKLQKKSKETTEVTVGEENTQAAA